MMKKTFQMMFALLAAVLVLASCSKKESVATRLIPENAIVVGRLDVKQTIDKSGLDANSRLLKKLKSAMSDTDMSEEMREKMMDIVLNPNQSGIDFDQPVFFYFTGNEDNMGGLVGTVDNKGKLTDLINQIASESGSEDEVEEEDGVCRVGEMMVFNDDWFFIGDVNDDMIETLKEMAESGEGSMAEDESMAKLCEQPGVFSMLVSGKGLGQIDDRDVRQALQQLPDGLDINDVAAITDLQLNDGAVQIHNVGRRLWTDPGRKLAAHLLGLPGLVKENLAAVYDNESLLQAFLRSPSEMPDYSYGFQCTAFNWEEIRRYQYYLAMAREIQTILTGKEGE